MTLQSINERVSGILASLRSTVELGAMASAVVACVVVFPVVRLTQILDLSPTLALLIGMLLGLVFGGLVRTTERRLRDRPMRWPHLVVLLVVIILLVLLLSGIEGAVA